MTRNIEDTIQAALEAHASGEFTSLRAVARAFAVPRPTLQGRINGATNHRAAAQRLQRLSPEQEKYLREWIIDEDQLARSPSHSHIREMAAQILRSNDDLEPLGRHWLESFLQQHPQVKSYIGKPIDGQRITGI
jgi:hypothetical protein